MSDNPEKANEVVTLDPARHGEATRDFEAFLRSKIVGQEAAIQAVTELYQAFLVGMNPPDRPLGNLLFLGPTGSGKTYVVEVVADALFRSPHAFIKVDCAEYQEAHEIAKLIGSPPGYLGHGQTQPLITQDSLSQWYTDTLRLSIVLFDEIEKASPALWQLLLGILDKATLTLGDNRHVNLSQAVIFMTSNLGAAEMSRMIEGGMGFVAGPTRADASLAEKITRTAHEAARRKFSPEFLNRIDKVVVFNTLGPEHLNLILELELEAVQRRISNAAGPTQSRFRFRCTPEVKNWLLREGTDLRYGARHLKRVIERHLVYALANIVASGQVGPEECVDVSLSPAGRLTFTKVVAAAKGLAAG
jgi:ATP-dependent Clp protease ATP-binding subunit ClpA